MAMFRALLDCHLNDLGFIGSKFTWSNGRSDDSFTKEPLDCVVANVEWCQTFKEVAVNVLAARSFDHKPLVISFLFHEEERPCCTRGFQFEASWLVDKDYLPILNNAWFANTVRNQGSLFTISQRLLSCKSILSHWSARKFRNNFRKLQQKTQLLEELQCVEGRDNRRLLNVCSQRLLSYWNKKTLNGNNGPSRIGINMGTATLLFSILELLIKDRNLICKIKHVAGHE